MSKLPSNNNLILEELQRTDGNLSRVARSLGLDYHALKHRMAPAPVMSFRTAVGPEPTDIRSLGRPGREKYVVAVKRAGEGWPVKYDQVIAEARKKYDAGLVEMCQHTANGWVVLYVIPRLVPAQRREYFSSMVIY